MRNRIVIFLIAIITVFITSSCTKSESQSKSLEQIYKEKGVPVTIKQIEKNKFSIENTFHSTLSGIQESNASAMVADKVEKIYYKVGDYVEKDAVVISFPTDNPSAQYNQTKSAYELAKTTLDRMTNLYNSGGISLQDFDNTKTQFKVAEANWDAVRQSIMVKAPISGTISQINVQESDNVSPGDALFTVSQTQKLKGKLWASESQAAVIKVGNNVTAKWQGLIIEGRVSQVDLSLNTSMQAFGVWVELNNSGKRFKSGINAEITIYSGEGDETIIVERKNVIVEENSNYVFVNQSGKAQKREIKTGRTQGLDIEVVEGLSVGDQLIVGGQMLLKDGEKIRVIADS